MCMPRRLAAALALCCPCLAVAAADQPPPAGQAQQAGQPRHVGQSQRVDFRYSPPLWQAAICMPDDVDKALAGKQGQFLDEFSSRSKAEPFGLVISHDVAGGSQWVGQRLLSPQVPIVQTRKQAGPVTIQEELFAVVPGRETTAAGSGPPLLRRVAAAQAPPAAAPSTPPEESRGWAKPRVLCDPAFCDVAVGWHGPLDYQLQVPPGRRMKIVVGLCEGYYDQAGRRLVHIEVEGAAPQIVDPVKEAGGQNLPVLRIFDAQDKNGDGAIAIRIAKAAGSKDPFPIVNALWAFEPERLPPPEEILRGEGQDRQYAFLRCGSSHLPYRQYLLTARYVNTGSTPARVVPKITVRASGIGYSAASGTIVAGGATAVRCEGVPQEFQKRPGVALLDPIELPPGGSQMVVIAIYRNGSIAPQPVSAQQAAALRADAAGYWTGEARLPLGAIQVPDPGIQDLLDSSIRNIYQAREIKNGLPAFQVGPTVYRGLFIADGAFLLEAAAIIGRPEEARAGIDYFLSFQRADGGIHVMDRYWKESGLTLWAATRQAFLAQDKDWLRARWPKLQRVAAYIHALRGQESAADPHALDYRLHPWGLVDGGLFHVGPELSNVYWSLAGLRAMVQAAHWLDDAAAARTWQAEYDDFYAVFRRAAQRELRVDSRGNRYLPVVMGPQQADVPQRGQWAFCHAVYPGQLFAQDDPIVTGTLNMLRGTECEGLVLDTGWLHGGIWNYFASFYGHALLWQGDGAKAAQVLYAFANHASPMLDWREEQKPQGQGAHNVGDMPHNWASAEFIRLAVHLLALDRGDQLHLLEGLPRAWTRPGMTTRLSGVCTPFGPLQMKLSVAADGQTARLQARLPGTGCKAIVVHLAGWSSTTPGAVQTLPADQPLDLTVPVLQSASPSP